MNFLELLLEAMFWLDEEEQPMSDERARELWSHIK